MINKFNEEKNNVTLIPGGVSWEFPAIASLNCLDHGTVTEIATNDANTLLDFFFFFSHLGRWGCNGMSLSGD